MPPKAKQKETNANQGDDGSGITKQPVDFKISMSVSYKEISDTNIVFQWFSGENLKDVDLGPIDAFPSILEDAKETSRLEPSKDQNVPKSTSNNVETSKLTASNVEDSKLKMVCAEHSEEGVLVDLNFCKKVTSSLINIYIINTESKKVLEMMSFDVSTILMHNVEEKGRECFRFDCNDWENGYNGIYDFKFTIEADKSLL